MANDEIRIKIAKLHGANWWELDGIAYLCGMAHAGLLPKGAKIVDAPTDGYRRLYRVKNWPVNIADAMGLIVEMQSEPYLQAIQITRVPAIGKRWVMWVGANITETGDTLPMVICLAYIQWKESQK
jgi:hypothetical protein